MSQAALPQQDQTVALEQMTGTPLPESEPATNEGELRTLAAFVFNLIEAQITRADTKAGLVVAADSVLIAIAAFFERRGGVLMLLDPAAPGVERLLSILYILMFGSLFASIMIGLVSTRPALIKKGSKGTLFFFGRIAEHQDTDYMELFSKQSLDEHHNALLKEVHNTARIAQKKFRRIHYSIDFLIAAVVLWVLIVFLNAVSFE